MVNFTKWVIIAAGLVFLGLFTQEAAATGLTGTLQRTGLAGGSVGGGIRSIGSGIGGFFTETLKPFWEIRNIIRGFMNLGSATPWLEDLPTQGGGTTTLSGQGGGSDTAGIVTPTTIETIQPTYFTTGGFSYRTDPTISPVPITDTTVTFKDGTSRDLPLSASAIEWYQNIGVEVNPDDGGGTNEFSGGGGGIAVTNTSSSNWGTNVSTPSGGVASGNLSLASWGNS